MKEEEEESKLIMLIPISFFFSFSVCLLQFRKIDFLFCYRNTSTMSLINKYTANNFKNYILSKFCSKPKISQFYYF